MSEPMCRGAQLKPAGETLAGVTRDSPFRHYMFSQPIKGNKVCRIFTCPNAYGKAEYMPAALSR